MRTIRQEIEIAATPEQVWEVLTDTDQYGEWNPFITRLRGPLEAGARLDVRIRPPGGRAMTFRPAVTDLRPTRRLEWLGHAVVPGVFDGRHSFTLEPLPGGRTRLVQAETFTGVAVRLAGTMLTRTEAGFRAMNEALRGRAESRAAGRTVGTSGDPGNAGPR